MAAACARAAHLCAQLVPCSARPGPAGDRLNRQGESRHAQLPFSLGEDARCSCLLCPSVHRMPLCVWLLFMSHPHYLQCHCEQKQDASTISSAPTQSTSRWPSLFCQVVKLWDVRGNAPALVASQDLQVGNTPSATTVLLCYGRNALMP